MKKLFCVLLAAALGLDAAVFDGMAGTVVEVATQAE